MLRLLNEGVGSAATHMECARRLLQGASQASEPVLHLFDWERHSVTFGVLVKPAQLLDLQAVERFGWDLSQRPTGGGIMFHVEDCSFSLLVPSSQPFYTPSPDLNYAWVNQCVARAIETCMGTQHADLLDHCNPAVCPRSARFCMSQPTRHDIFWNGKKVGGAAQRHTRHGFLHQGSIALQLCDPVTIRQSLLHPDHVVPGMEQHAGALLDFPTPQTLQDLRRSLQQNLYKEFRVAMERRHDDSVMMETL
jgi:lipoate-protein ligase A